MKDHSTWIEAAKVLIENPYSQLDSGRFMPLSPVERYQNRRKV